MSEEPQPHLPPLRSVYVTSFASSHVFVVGATQVSISWECEGAAHVNLHRRQPDSEEWQVVPGKVNFAKGQISVLVERDTYFRIRAYPQPEPGEQLDDSMAAEQTLLVDRVPRVLFYTLLVAVILALISFWYLSEGLIHGVDLIDNHWLLQLGIIFSRMLAVGASVFGAPLVAAMLQIRAGRSTTTTDLAFDTLRNRALSGVILVASLIPPTLVALVHFHTRPLYISSEIERPIHVWACDEDEQQVSHKSALRLTIPPGLSSVRVMSSLDFEKCVTPEGVVQLNRPIRSPSDRSLAVESSESTHSRSFFDSLFEPPARITLTCDQRVVLAEADTTAYRYHLQWDDDAMTPFDEVAGGTSLIAKKFVGDCTSYSRWARFEQETAVGSATAERHSWRVALDRSGKSDTFLPATTPRKISFDEDVGSPAHVTLGASDTWQSTKTCRATGECEIPTPKDLTPGGASYLCITPQLPVGTPNTAEDCHREQPWSYFQTVEGVNSIEMHSLVVCLPPGQPGTDVGVESEHAAWRGALTGARPKIPWPNTLVDETVTLTVGDQVEIVPVRTGDKIRPTMPTRERFSVTITLNRVPKRLSSKCELQPLYETPTEQLCELRSEVIASGTGQHMTFENLPEWAVRRNTQWGPRPGHCSSLPETATCTLILRGSTRELHCTGQ